MTAYDDVVVGAGINGLVAAAELAGAGRRVCLVDAGQRIGGFVAGHQSAPGYHHDTYSSWHPLFVTGGAYAELGDALARHGLVYANTDHLLFGSVADDGQVTVAHRDPQATAAGFAHGPDRDAYLRMLDDLGAQLPVIGALLGGELRSAAAVRPLLRMARGGRTTIEAWARATATSGRAYLRRTFHGPEADHLWAPWLLHAGLAPDNASGGLMVPLFAGTIHTAGLPVAVGGMTRFITAWERLLAERSVDVVTDAPIDAVDVRDGRAVAVRSGGRRIEAAHNVLASVTPHTLYERLLPSGTVDTAVRTEARQYRAGRAAMQIHLALEAPPAWRDERLRHVPLVHVGDGSASTAIACAEAEAGLLPRRPTIVVGQQCVLDPSRAPAGAATLWLQLQELPFVPSGDAAGLLNTSRGWDAELVDGYAGRVLDRIEQHAPGLRASIRSTSVIDPANLAAANPNAERGDPYCGSAELDQNLLWRPGPRTGRHRTAVRGLWHIGAATHPGPGLGGGSGHLVARSIIDHARPLPSRLARRPRRGPS